MNIRNLEEFRRSRVAMTPHQVEQLFGESVDHSCVRVHVYANTMIIEELNEGGFFVCVNNQDLLADKERAEEFLWDEFAKYEFGLSDIDLVDEIKERAEYELMPHWGGEPELFDLDALVEVMTDLIDNECYSSEKNKQNLIDCRIRAMYYMGELERFDVEEVPKKVSMHDRAVNMLEGFLTDYQFDRLHPQYHGYLNVSGGDFTDPEMEKTWKYICDNKGIYYDELQEMGGFTESGTLDYEESIFHRTLCLNETDCLGVIGFTVAMDSDWPEVMEGVKDCKKKRESLKESDIEIDSGEWFFDYGFDAAGEGDLEGTVRAIWRFCKFVETNGDTK